MTKTAAYERLTAKDATSVLVINDLHENTSMLERALSATRSENGKTVLVISDILNHDARMQTYQAMGLAHPSQILPSYVASKLTEQQREVFQIGQALDAYGGLEAYIEALRRQQPGLNEQAFRQQFGDAYKHYQSEYFQKTVQNTVAQAPPEEKEALRRAELQAAASLAITNEYMDAQGLDAIARTLKKYESNIAAIVVGAGNHDNPLHVRGLEERLGKHVYWSESIGGAIQAGDIAFQVTTNTGGLIPSSESYVYNQHVQELYAHLLHPGHMDSGANVQKLDEATLKRSPTYQRMQGVESLDFLVSHFDDINGDKSVFPMPKDAGSYWAMSKLKPDGVVLSGHMHQARDGINVAGYRAVRQPGATLITKRDGQLSFKTVAPFTQFDTVYDVAAFKKRLEQDLPDYIKQIVRAAQQQRAA